MASAFMSARRRTRWLPFSQAAKGVYGIAMGRVWQEVSGRLAELPDVPIEAPEFAGNRPADGNHGIADAIA
jgi:hypothetical protein